MLASDLYIHTYTHKCMHKHAQIFIAHTHIERENFKSERVFETLNVAICTCGPVHLSRWSIFETCPRRMYVQNLSGHTGLQKIKAQVSVSSVAPIGSLLRMNCRQNGNQAGALNNLASGTSGC